MIMDPSRPRLYLANISSDTIVVLNTTSNKEVTSLVVGSGPRGMDISADGKELYVALSGDNALAVVDLDQLTLARTIHLPDTPSDVAAGRLGRAYVTTSSGSNLPIVVDTNNSRVIAQVNSPAYVFFGGEIAKVSPDRQTIYFGTPGISPSEIYRFSIRTDNVTFVDQSPSERAIDNLQEFAVSPDGSRLYVSSGYPYYVQVLSTTDWKSIANLTTGAYVTSVSLNSAGTLAFAFHETVADEVVVFDTNTFLAVAHIPVGGQQLAGGLVRATADGKRAYVVSSGQLLMIDVAKDASTTTSSGPVIATNGTQRQTPTWPLGSTLIATNVKATSVFLSWGTANGLTNQDLNNPPYYSISYGISEYEVPATVHSHNFTRLQPSTTYTFRVEASNPGTPFSTDGPSVTITTLQAAPPSVSSLVLSAISAWGVYILAIVVVVAGAAAVVIISRRPRKAPAPIYIPSPAVPPSTATTTSVLKRPNGLTIITVLWGIAGIYNLYTSAHVISDDWRVIPRLSSPLIDPWLRAGLPLELILSVCIFFFALAQFVTIYGLWTRKSWSYYAALVLPIILEVFNTLFLVLYASAPGSLHLAYSNDVVFVAMGVFWIVTYWRYIRQPFIKYYLNVKSPPTASVGTTGARQPAQALASANLPRRNVTSDL